MRATKKQAKIDIKRGDFESDERTRNNKRRNCVFCGKNIPKDTDFYRNFDYPYEKNLPRWFACLPCFKNAGGPVIGSS